MLGRRGFIGSLLGLVAAGPAVAQSAADASFLPAGAAIGQLNATSSYGVGQNIAVSQKVVQEATLAYYRAFGLPKDIRYEWMRQARQQANSCRLDPDIASLRSFSNVAKMSMQVERNFNRRLDEFLQRATSWEEQTELYSKHKNLSFY